MILNNVQEMKKIDSRGVMSILDSFPEHCEIAIKLGKVFSKEIKKKYDRFGILGMGGSGISGRLVKDYFPDTDIRVFSGYDLPKFVGRDWLLIAISYSGKTEETLYLIDQAVKRKISMVVITSGKQLASFCRKRKIPCLSIPSGFPPRFGLPYMFFPLLEIIVKAGVSFNEDLKTVLKDLQETREEVQSSTPFDENPAKRSAYKIRGTVPMFMATPSLSAVAYRAKTQINENAKIQAANETFPELNHNSLLSWSKPDSVSKAFSVILLSDHKEHKQIKKRVEFTRPYVKHAARNVIFLHSVYRMRLSRILCLMYTLDYMSVYLALFYGRDPGDDKLLEELKKNLKK